LTAGSWRPETEPTLPLRGDTRPKGDPNPNAGSFYRSDQVSFAKVGIDFIDSLGFDPAEMHLRHYHQVTDEIHPERNLAGTVRDMRILFETAPRVAGAPEQPHWAAWHEFEEEWKALYGKK